MKWRLAVVGSPITHSLSPQLHEAGLALAGLEGTSSRLEIGLEGADHLRELLLGSYDALSVTMPLKGVAAQLCDELDDVATRTGVVNSLLVRGGRVLGTCTDGPGFVKSLEEQFDVDLRARHAVILGAGGAAKGIVDALVQANVSSVTVLGRTASRVQELVERYHVVTNDDTQGIPVDLIVNTLPATGRPLPTLERDVHAQTIAIDITYEPRMSDWRALYESQGCRSANGLGMLSYQAALQMQWWWGVALDGAKLLEVVQ